MSSSYKLCDLLVCDDCIKEDEIKVEIQKTHNYAYNYDCKYPSVTECTCPYIDKDSMSCRCCKICKRISLEYIKRSEIIKKGIQIENVKQCYECGRYLICIYNKGDIFTSICCCDIEYIHFILKRKEFSVL